MQLDDLKNGASENICIKKPKRRGRWEKTEIRALRDIHAKVSAKRNKFEFWRHVASFMAFRDWTSVRNKAEALGLRPKIEAPMCPKCTMRKCAKGLNICSVCDAEKDNRKKESERNRNPAITEMISDLNSSIVQIAEVAGVTRQAVYKWIRNGKIGDAQAAYTMMTVANSMYPGKWPDERLKELMGVKAAPIIIGDYVDLETDM